MQRHLPNELFTGYSKEFSLAKAYNIYFSFKTKISRINIMLLSVATVKTSQVKSVISGRGTYLRTYHCCIP